MAFTSLKRGTIFVPVFEITKHLIIITASEKSLLQTLGTFPPNFQAASLLQLMGRWGFCGIFTLLSLHSVVSADEGDLELSHSEKGSIIGNVAAIQHSLPLVFGMTADHIGYKLSLTISCLIMAVDCYLMGEVSTYWSTHMVFLFTAIRRGFSKPAINGAVAWNTDDTTSTLGFGIFYMMANIGGFIGPAMSSLLRTMSGWHIIFVQAAVVMIINLLVMLFLYKEPKMAQRDSKPLLTEIKESALHIIEALRDSRLITLFMLAVGFWMTFNQLFCTLPNFIRDWVDSLAMSQWINQHLPFLGTVLTESGRIKAERFVSIDSLMTTFFQIVVPYFVTKMTHVNAVICGIIIDTIGITFTFMFNNVRFTIIGTMVLSVGKMAVSPMLSAFITQIIPKGKEALYQGTCFFPAVMGNYLAGLISGDSYKEWSDRYTFLQAKMVNRQAAISEGLTRNEYFAPAERKLGLSQSQTTEMLWQTYAPKKMWYLIFGIGIFATVSLYLHNKIMVEKVTN